MGKTQQSIVINAGVDKVWKAIRSFHDMSWAPNVISELQIVGDIAGDQVGAMRLLNGAFRETLLNIDNEKHVFSYSIDDGPSPVSKADVANYVGRVHVTEAEGGAGSQVEWTSSWEKNDELAAEFCHGIYVAFLGDMKKSLE
jgi:hypothetical protein